MEDGRRREQRRGAWRLSDDGPATALTVMKCHQRVGGDPRQWVAAGARERNIDMNDLTHHEMTCLTEAM